MAKHIFFEAMDNAILVSIDSVHVGLAENAKELAELLKAKKANIADRFSTSSSIDFAGEYGFKSHAAARTMLEKAFAELHKKLFLRVNNQT
jgi:hypothetical protein